MRPQHDSAPRRRMAIDAGCCSERVVVIDVAACAGNRCGVKTSQRKTGCRVIEYRSSPGGGRKAQRAVSRECGGNMIRYHPAKRCGALVLRCMAIDAGC